MPRNANKKKYSKKGQKPRSEMGHHYWILTTEKHFLQMIKMYPLTTQLPIKKKSWLFFLILKVFYFFFFPQMLFFWEFFFFFSKISWNIRDQNLRKVLVFALISDESQCKSVRAQLRPLFVQGKRGLTQSLWNTFTSFGHFCLFTKCRVEL